MVYNIFLYHCYDLGVYVLSLLLYLACCLKASPDARRLYDDKLKSSGYNKLIRPVGNISDTLVVHIGLRLTQIIDVVSIAYMLYINDDLDKCVTGCLPNIDDKTVPASRLLFNILLYYHYVKLWHPQHTKH